MASEGVFVTVAVDNSLTHTYTACTQFIHSLYTVYTQLVHSLYTACTQLVYPHIHTYTRAPHLTLLLDAL